MSMSLKSKFKSKLPISTALNLLFSSVTTEMVVSEMADVVSVRSGSSSSSCYLNAC